jgi:AraC-like DNA-binding protein
LMYTDESLADIALTCGFADQSHFSREFRRQFGRTPRAYREHYRLDPGGSAPVVPPRLRSRGPNAPLRSGGRARGAPSRSDTSSD